MAGPVQTPKELSSGDRKVLQTWVEEFERVWDMGRLASVTRFLPSAEKGPLRHAILVALVVIDLRRQWERGVRVAAESYLTLYPELGNVETCPPEIVRAEFEVRQRVGPAITWEELSLRFPKQVAFLLQAGADEPTRPPPSPKLTDVVSVGEGSARAVPVELKGRFGRYEIERLLGKGGMGNVYLAFDTQLKRFVALKVPHRLRKPDPSIIARFVREARAAANLIHPNICPIYDIGEHDDLHYLTMAYVEGESLAKVIENKRPLPQRWVAECVYHLALALDEAHRHGIIHRDLKPSNIMINERNEPVMMDFGLARLLNEAQIPLTQTDVPLGTPAYMAPEHISGQAGANSPSCDIYSLGIIMYEMLTGTVPYDGPQEAVMSLILTGEPEPPSALRRDLDPRLEAICLKAIARAPSNRYPTMREFALALGEFLNVPAASPLEQTTPQVGEAEPSGVDAVFNYTTVLEPSELPDAFRALPATPTPLQTSPIPESPPPPEEVVSSEEEPPPLEEEEQFLEEEEEEFATSEAEVTPGRRRIWLRLLLASVSGILLGGLMLAIQSLMFPTKVSHSDGTARPEPGEQQKAPAETVAATPERTPSITPRETPPAPPPEPVSGTISVAELDPGPDATFRLDGKRIDRSELSNMTLPAGEHLLQIRGSDIDDIDVSFTVKPGTNVPLKISPVYLGNIQIQVKDANDATVKVDGEVQRDLSRPLRLRVGPHELRVEGPDIATLTQKFPVRRNPNPVLEVTPTLLGTVVVELSEPDAAVEIRIDGQVQRTFPVRLPVATHRLRVSGERYETVEQSFTVARGTNAALRIPLQLRAEFRPPAEFKNSLGMAFRFVPAGTFTMGSPGSEADRLPDEAQHEVRIERPFYLGAVEVRVGDFRAFVDAAKYQTDAEKEGKGAWRLDNNTQMLVRDPGCTWTKPGWEQTDAHPVVCVSWRDAKEFCKWVSAKEGKSYRLAYEKEWEYACRAGTATAFSTGNTLAAADANFNGSRAAGGAFRGQTTPAGTFPKNPLGLFDMHGNVWEWCEDPYRKNSADDKGADTTVRILRGGSWFDPAKFCRSAYRSFDTPERCYPYVGFRVVCEVPNKHPIKPATSKK